MKQNRVNTKSTRPDKKGTILAVTFVLAILFFSLAFAKQIDKADKDSKGEVTRLSEVKTEAVQEKIKESAQKRQVKPKASFLSPAQVSTGEDTSATEIKPAERQDTKGVLSSAVKDKGRQIKWQILASGAGCGDGASAYRMEMLIGCVLCGTVGQLAVGSGSSQSFGLNGGFWQEFLQGYSRGDVNTDGVVDVGDVVYLINYLYRNGPAPDPLWVGDCNCDGLVDVGDVVFLINYLYRDGDPPIC